MDFSLHEILDPLNLGKDLAINLGINYQKIFKTIDDYHSYFNFY